VYTRSLRGWREGQARAVDLRPPSPGARPGESPARARRSSLPDFYIGAHAAVSRLTLLTRDPCRYRTFFPSLEVIAPQPWRRIPPGRCRW